MADIAPSCACTTEQDVTAVQGALRHGIPGSGAAAVRARPLLRHDETVSAVDKANSAAVRALDQPRHLPGAQDSKPQPQAGKENRSREAANTGHAPPALLKRPPSQSGIPPRCAPIKSYLLANECQEKTLKPALSDL